EVEPVGASALVRHHATEPTDRMGLGRSVSARACHLERASVAGLRLLIGALVAVGAGEMCRGSGGDTPRWHERDRALVVALRSFRATAHAVHLASRNEGPCPELRVELRA